MCILPVNKTHTYNFSNLHIAVIELHKEPGIYLIKIHIYVKWTGVYFTMWLQPEPIKS